jgi:hypothetical protein
MDLLNRRTLLKKLTVIITVSTLGFFNATPLVEARTNPNPSIFKEFPYNRTSPRTRKRRPKPQQKRQIRKNNTRRLKKQPSVIRSNRKPSNKPTRSGPGYIEFSAPGY